LKLNNFFLVKARPDGFQDDFLIRADKNPNSKGAEFIGYKYDDKAVANFFESCSRGEVEGVIVFGQDLLTLHGSQLKESALNKLKWSVFIGSNHNVMSEYATYVLPSAVYAEKDGTFTNFEGKVQKFERVFNPIKEALPEWTILRDMAKHLNIHMTYDYAEELFHELALAVEAFKGLDYEKLKASASGTDIRVLAEPMIPRLTQDSGLIFFKEQHKPSEPGPAVIPGPQTVKTQ
jgi:NADH-quinone oxidoreductase subunit G